MTYATHEKKAVSTMTTPADRDLAIEVANERIRQSRISAKLTKQAKAWAERNTNGNGRSSTPLKLNQEKTLSSPRMRHR